MSDRSKVPARTIIRVGAVAGGWDLAMHDGECLGRKSRRRNRMPSPRIAQRSFPASAAAKAYSTRAARFDRHFVPNFCEREFHATT
jgi:hypothetical protein